LVISGLSSAGPKLLPPSQLTTSQSLPKRIV
jgi:hypothetical protein